MYLKTLEQQLKSQGWKSNFQDPKMAKKLYEQAIDALANDEKVFSLTCAKKIEVNGEVSKSQYLLVLTKKDLFFVELDTAEDIWHSAPQRIDLTKIRLLDNATSKANPKAIRINIISSEKAFVFESLDSDSALHFASKAQGLLKGDNEKMNDETLNLTKSRDFQDLEAINTTTTTTNRPAKNKDHHVFNYFFNFSSLFKSLPAMEVLFLIFELVWIICDIIFIALVDAMKLNSNANIALGVIMLIFDLLAMGILIPYIMNIWKPGTITNKAKIFILMEVLLFLLLVVSITMLAELPSAFIFGVIGLFAAMITFAWTGAEFSKKILELHESQKTKKTVSAA